MSKLFNKNAIEFTFKVFSKKETLFKQKYFHKLKSFNDLEPNLDLKVTQISKAFR